MNITRYHNSFLHKSAVRSSALPLLCAALLSQQVGCTSGDPDRDPLSVETQHASLGESTTAFFSETFNPYHTIYPTRTERTSQHLYNRARISPTFYHLERKLPDGSMEATPPNKPFQSLPSIAVPLQWLAYHRIEYDCLNCKNSQTDNSIATRACALSKIDNDVLVSYGQRLDCQTKSTDKDKETNRQSFRYKALSRGPASISDSNATNVFVNGDNTLSLQFLSAFAAEMLLPTTAKMSNRYGYVDSGSGYKADFFSYYPAYTTNNSCAPLSICQQGGGACRLNSDPESAAECNPTGDDKACYGVCHGGDYAGIRCPILKEGQEVCQAKKAVDKKELPGFLLLQGEAQASLIDSDFFPVLLDGVAIQLARWQDGEGNRPDGFGTTADKEVEFAVNYFEPSGAPKAMKVVIDDNQCVDLEQWSKTAFDGGTQNPAPDYTTPSNYFGEVLRKRIKGLSKGCHRYYFVVVDKNGVEHTYPEYGSLGVAIDDKGNIDYANIKDLADPSKLKAGECNSFTVDERAKIPAVCSLKAVCTTGSTRSCYTGDKGNIGNGACKAGKETCVNGQWSGICKDQVLPKLYESCLTDVDDNCNGRINEGCPDYDKEPPKPDKPVIHKDPNAGDGDGDGSGRGQGQGDQDSKNQSKSGGCSTLPASPASSPLLPVLSFLFGFVLFRRRRS